MNDVKICKQCDKLFERKRTEGPQYWAIKRYCSNLCARKSPLAIEKMRQSVISGFVNGRIVWNKDKKGLQKAWNKGNGEYAKKLGFGKWMIGRKGELNGAWKGENAGYGALHEWVRRELGTPNKCLHCGKSSKFPQGMHWANVSNNYKRDLSDWIRLCAKCHKLFDKGRKQIKFIRR